MKQKINIMEVCGTHTMAIAKYNIRSLYKDVNLISGPGCPVCVTPDAYIDYVYKLSLKENVIIATYGDMIRVPGSKPWISLENAKGNGAKVKIVYSSMDALKLAVDNPSKTVVFLGIGFETTAPATAIALLEAKKQNINNFKVFSMHKLVEPVMRKLLEDKEVHVDGFLLPGHVAVVIGEDGFEFLKEYNSCGTIAGFESMEIQRAMDSIIKMCNNGTSDVKNEYKSLVRKSGNPAAKNIISMVFSSCDDLWRGMGEIKNSGLQLNKEYVDFDITKIYEFNEKSYETKNGCKCGEVLKGLIKPNECPLFNKVCCPDNPVGPCMVSSEGSCAAYYRYKDINIL